MSEGTEKFVYDDKIVRLFLGATVLWGIVGTVVEAGDEEHACDEKSGAHNPVDGPDLQEEGCKRQDVQGGEGNDLGVPQ